MIYHTFMVKWLGKYTVRPMEHLGLDADLPKIKYKAFFFLLMLNHRLNVACERCLFLGRH